MNYFTLIKYFSILKQKARSADRSIEVDRLQKKYEVRFWTNDDGEKPVAKWLKALGETDRRVIVDLLQDLAFDGPRSRPKVFKHLEGSLWEVRDLRTGPGYRLYFGFDGHTICLVLNAGNKSGQQRDIDLAKSRLKEME